MAQCEVGRCGCDSDGGDVEDEALERKAAKEERLILRRSLTPAESG